MLASAPTKCVEVQAPLDSDYRRGIGGPIDGGAVQVFDCRTAQLNQKWWTTGAIEFGALNRIVRRTSDADGASPTLYTRSLPLPTSDKWDLW